MEKRKRRGVVIKNACVIEEWFCDEKYIAEGAVNGMKGYPMEYELRFIVWNGIREAVEKAVERKDIEAYALLKEAVEYYNENFVLSGRELERMLKKLESLNGEA